MQSSSYHIRLSQFEGPFDLLLFFIERDELDIYNIPIHALIKDFLAFVHGSEQLNIELSSEFILFVSTLMRIKAKMLLPRKEIDSQGNEIDPRQELVNKVLEYRRFKEAAAALAEKEEARMQLVRRGNLHRELWQIGELSGEGTEIQSVSLFKLMKTFERVMGRMEERAHPATHTVVQYHYTIEGSRSQMLELCRRGKSLAFAQILPICENRVHAVFLFLSILELVQQGVLEIMLGEGVNNFILAYQEPLASSAP